jgi:hypothetical protein
VSFVSFTVPQNQQEESYFAPLAGLAVGPETEVTRSPAARTGRLS